MDEKSQIQALERSQPMFPLERSRLLQTSLATRAEAAEPDPIRGLVESTVKGKCRVVEYEPDSELRDTEQVPLLEEGSIEAFLRREVLPYAEDAWYDPASVKTGYEISFTRYFYKPQPLRTAAASDCAPPTRRL